MRRRSRAELEARLRCELALDQLARVLSRAQINEFVAASQAVLDAGGTAAMLAEQLEKALPLFFPDAGRVH